MATTSPDGIKVRLGHVLLDRSMTLSALADEVGISLANLSILKTGKAKAIRFSTLAALCKALQCQPGDLVTYEPVMDERRDQR